MFFFKVSLILDLWQFVSSSCMYLRKISGLSHLLFHRNRALLILSVLHLPIYFKFFQFSTKKYSFSKSMQILRKLAPQLPLHSLLAPLAPLGFKKIFARFLASISVQIWRNVTKNTKNTDFKKTVPPAAPRLHAPLAPLEI